MIPQQRSNERILFVADHLGYPGGVIHGATTYFTHVLPALAASGLQVTACFLREPHPAAERLLAEGIEVLFLGARRLHPLTAHRVAEIAAARGCGILHSAGYEASLIAKVLAHREGARALIHIHDMNIPPLHVRLLQRAAAQPDDVALCVSHAAESIAVRGYYVQPDRVKVVYTGIRTEEFPLSSPELRAEVRDELELPEDALVLGMFGRFHRIKGHEDLIQAMPVIARALPAARLILAGDGPERRACEARVRSLGLTRVVRFLGTRNDVPRMMAATDVVVMPSRAEGLGRTAIEANLCGCPVVGYDTGGLREVITDDLSGQLVETATPPALAEAIISALCDASLRSVAAANERARRARERFSLEAHVRLLRECYGTA